jgi:hypothetical protein
MRLGATIVPFALISTAAAAAAQPLPYPVRNGDFERPGGWGRPQHWISQIMDGAHEFGYNADAPAGERHVTIASKGGSARWCQVGIPVFAGQYRLTLRARGTPGATAHVLVSGEGVTESATFEPTEAWEEAAIELTAPKAGEVGVYLHAIGAGTVGFDDVSLEEVRIESGPVLTDGNPLGAIVLPDAPSPAERFAAYELQRVLHVMTGIHLGLTGRDETAEGRVVYVGRAAPPELLDRATLNGEEEYAVVVRAEGIALAGGGDRGTLYAAYEFLRSLGCRWLMPGDIGEVIPRRERLVLRPCDERFAPDYAVRGFMTVSAITPPGGEGWIPADMDALLDYAVRNRFNALWWGGGATEEFEAHRGFGHEQTLNHSYDALVPDSLFAEHPDWFPLVAGKREPTHSSGRPNQLCVSNPQMREHVAQQALEYFRTHPRAKAFALNANDEPACWCECEACKALDTQPVNWSKNGTDVLPLTDRVVNFVNYVAARVAEEYPDRLIEMYAYASTTDAPVREMVHPNVLVKYAVWPSQVCLRHDIFDATCDRNREFVARIRAWMARAKHLGIYHYGDYRYIETPACWYADTVKLFRGLHKMGAEHVLGETENTMPGSALWYYLIGRTLWDVDTDSEAVIDDFCTAFYGPAAAQMADYYRTLEGAVRDDAERAGEANETANNLQRYTPEVIRAARACLRRATQAAGDDDLIKARIDHAWFSLLFTQATATAEVGPYTQEAFRSAKAAFDRMQRIQRERQIFGALWAAPRLREFWVPPIAAQQGDLLAELPLVWKFRLDPDDLGEQSGWATAEPDVAWSDIRTDASWTDQGYAYHGVAWYKTQVEAPHYEPGRAVWLLFGAVDGDCWVWIDGKPAGQRMDPSGLLWDKPFALDVTNLIRPGATHRLTVKVRKDRFAAGIWKRVELRRKRAQTP